MEWLDKWERRVRKNTPKLPRKSTSIKRMIKNSFYYYMFSLSRLMSTKEVAKKTKKKHPNQTKKTCGKCGLTVSSLNRHLRSCMPGVSTSYRALMPEVISDQAAKRASKVTMDQDSYSDFFFCYLQAKRILKKCSLCGKIYRRVNQHLQEIHKLVGERYREVFVYIH